MWGLFSLEENIASLVFFWQWISWLTNERTKTRWKWVVKLSALLIHCGRGQNHGDALVALWKVSRRRVLSPSKANRFEPEGSESIGRASGMCSWTRVGILVARELLLPYVDYVMRMKLMQASDCPRVNVSWLSKMLLGTEAAGLVSCCWSSGNYP